jgi:hypothetical protein
MRPQTPSSVRDKRQRLQQIGEADTFLRRQCALLVGGGQHWYQRRAWTRITSLALPAVLALALGAALRRTTQPELQRAAPIAWLAAALFAVGETGSSG